MKKLLSIAAAVIMLFTINTCVFAAEAPSPVKPETVNMTKEYTLTVGDTTPFEVLEFEVKFLSGVTNGADGDPVVGENGKVQIVNGTELTTDLPITFPTYSKPGVYTYQITEATGSTLGVGYDTADVFMIVSITNPKDGEPNQLVSKVAFHKGSLDGEKNDGLFKNTYDLGQLTVKKTVDGNLSSNTKKFTIHVTFSYEGNLSIGNDITYSVAGVAADKPLSIKEGKATADIELSNDESAEFHNIPAGVSYTVVEDEKHTKGDPKTTEEGYTVTYSNSDKTDKESSGLIAAGDKDTVTVKNYKNTEIETGIRLDNIPYAVMLCAAIAMAVFMFDRRRSMNEE